MLIGKRIRLIPTEEQEDLFRKSCGVARWAYNYFIEKQINTLMFFKQGLVDYKYTKETKVRKEITRLKKTGEYSWLNEVGSNVIKQSVKNADEAFKRFFNKTCKYPRFKKKGKCKESFYVNYESCRRVDKNHVYCEKLGSIETLEDLPELKLVKYYRNDKSTNTVREGFVVHSYSRPYISYDGKYWYLSFSYSEEDLINYKNNNIQLTDNSLGIDLGLKDLVIVSNQDNSFSKKFKNINKSNKIKKLEKRLKREQRKLSRKLLANTESYEEGTAISKKDGKEYKYKKPVYKVDLLNCKNIQKQNYKIRLIYKKLRDIRTNYIHQITSEIVKIKPFQIVMENLNISGLLKNKHLSKSIQNAKWYEIRRQIEYKCKRLGIDFVLVDRFYPSSKLCSNCHSIKKDLKLKDRIYHCDCCGATIDRDINASINLANYNLK